MALRKETRILATHSVSPVARNAVDGIPRPGVGLGVFLFTNVRKQSKFRGRKKRVLPGKSGLCEGDIAYQQRARTVWKKNRRQALHFSSRCLACVESR